MKHTFKEWFAATRYWSFVVSSMPVLVTFCWLCSKHYVGLDAVQITNFVLAIVGAVVLHAAGNVISDWWDYRSGVDNENSCGADNLVKGRFAAKEYLVYAICLFAAGIAIGLALTAICWHTWNNGWMLLAIGGAGVLLTAGYSFLKFHALGDLDIFLIFGVLECLGTAYVLTGHLVWESMCIALPVGMITVSVLHANNTVDTVSDGDAGIKTFAMLIGCKASAILYIAYMVLPFVCLVANILTGMMHWAAGIALFAAIQAVSNARRAAQFPKKGIEALSGLDIASSQLQMKFSLLLSAGLFIATFLPF